MYLCCVQDSRLTEPAGHYGGEEEEEDEEENDEEEDDDEEDDEEEEDEEEDDKEEEDFTICDLCKRWNQHWSVNFIDI